MEEARAVLERLRRVETLDRRAADPALILDELRALIAEAERWLEAEGGGLSRATRAVDGCRAALEREREVMPVS